MIQLQKSIRKFRAKLANTFVTDCPVCHKHFYGFHPYKLQQKINKRNYRIICHRCAALKFQLTPPNLS